MSTLPFLLLLLFSIPDRPVLGEEEADTTLELTQLLFRHGARSPITLYPNDPNNNVSALWPMGLGQLTKPGKEMHYALGRWLRKRYDKLVSPKWFPDEVTVRSTDMDRTLMSAACNLAGFYYPNHEDERFEKNLPWLPTPIHTIPAKLDKLLLIEDACPRITAELENLKYLPEVKKVMEENKEFFKFLADKTGQPVEKITTVEFLYDTLKIEAANNLTLPSWTNGLMEKLRKLSDFNFSLMAQTEVLKRLRSGPLVKEFTKNMHEKVTGKASKTKMFMFSAHDITVSMMMETLGVYNGISPPYAATFLLELHRVKDQHYVKMFYHNETNMYADPHPLVLPGCSKMCPLEKWTSLTAHVISKDWEKECHAGFPFGLPLSTFSAICVAVALGVLLLLLLTYNIISWYRHKSQFAYQAVPSSTP